MRIELISQDDYNFIMDVYNKYPALSFQNDGYEYLDKSKLTDKETKAFNEVQEILANCIAGFREFNHFRCNKAGQPQIRFQYDYNYDGRITFIGVGYLLIDELLNGFKE